MDLPYFCYRFKYRFGRSLPLKKPVDIALELSSKCNMRCSYCYHADPDALKWTPNFMGLETAERILYDAAYLKVPSVKLNWRGESTMNPHFNQITGLAKRLSEIHKGAFIDRITNSNFLFPTHRTDIFDGLANQTKVKISYDSFIPEVFDFQRGGGNHEIITRNIDKFYNTKNRKTKIILQAIRTNQNKDEPIIETSKRRWPEIEISIRDMVEGRNEKDVSDLAVKKRDPQNRRACIQAFTRLIFDSFGYAVMCCPDIERRLILGQIHTKTIKQLFNSQYAKAIRERLKSGLAFQSLKSCINCSSFESYKGYKPKWDS